MWVKICGLSSIETVNAAIAAGANAVGFVFAPSKRQVTAQQALAITRDVPSTVQRVAVMLHPSQALLDEVWSIFKPDMLQTDAEDLLGLRLPNELIALPVMRAGKSFPKSLPSRILFEGATSGAGEVADWTQAATIAQQTHLVLAGGLHAKNVAAAIAQVKPFGVDVSSGVESAPGVKDVRLIAEFVRRVRELSASE